MKKNIAKSVVSSLALAGLLLCGNARAQIALQDGSLTQTTTTGSHIVSINNFTVTTGAKVLVVLLEDRNNVTGNVSPTTIPWIGGQNLTRVLSVNGTASTYADSDIFYLFNPTPGTQTITATDTAANTPSVMSMQAYTLSGVDTTVTPVPYTANNGAATTVQVTLAGGTPTLAWGAVISALGTQPATMTITSSSGTPNYTDVNNTINFAMGYISSLSAGASTVTSTVNTSQKLALGVAVFTPFLPGPSAPTSVVATGQQGQIALSWADSSGGLATSYNVLRSTTSGGPYTQVINTASTSYNDTSLSTFVTYYYVIQAVDGAGVGPYSAEVSALATGVPANPVIVSAVAYDTYVVLTWNAATGASTYNVLRSTTSGSETVIASGLTATTYTNSSLANGTTYYYEVQAVNGVGTSGNSNETNATPQPLAAPTGLAAVGYGTQAGLSWNASFGATSYNVLRSTTSGGETLIASGLASPYFNDIGLTTGTTYYYEVQAVDSFMTSASSAEASTTPQSLPALTGVIAVQNGAFTSGIISLVTGASTAGIQPPTITKTNFTVTPGADLLVVPLYLQYSNGLTTLTDISPTTLTWGGQTLTKVFAQVNTGSGSPPAICATYYLFNPIPGTHSITCADTTGKAVWEMGINAFSLNNVDTTVAPVAGGFAAQFTPPAGEPNVNFASAPFGACVIVNAAQNPSSGNFTSTSGTTNYQVIAEPSGATPSFAHEDIMTGGVLGLAVGSQTISEHDAGGGSPRTFSAVMFAAVVAGPANPPTGLSATGQTNQILLNWTADSGATGFYISRSLVTGGPYTPIATNNGAGAVSYIDTTVGNYTNYYYVVQGFNSSGFSSYSGEATAAAIGNPLTPTGLAAVGYGTSVALSWNLQPSASSYNVLRSTISGSGYAQIASGVTGTLPYYTDTGLTTGTTYYYVVQSVNQFGTSASSAQASATPQALPPPTGQIAVQDGSLTVISNGTSSVTMPVTVSPGANVLVVALFDKSGTTNDTSPASLNWRDETVTKIVGPLNTREGSVSALYYLTDPTPGTGVITATDSLGIAMAMQVYTLNNVDNSQGGFAAALSQNFNNAPWASTAATFFGLPGGCFGVVSAMCGSATANFVHVISTSGTVTLGTKIVGGDDVGMGGIVNMATGDGTITETNGTGGVAGVLAVAVFPPLILGPSTPVSLTATGETNEIDLAWQDSSGGSATSYVVLRSTVSNSGFVAIATNTGNANVTYNDTNVVNYTTYYYEVAAVNSAGPSAPTAPVSANSVGISSPPTGLVGLWGNNTATLSWNASSNAASYVVLRSTTSGSGYVAIATNTGIASTTYTDTAVVNYTTYYYVVTAVNPVGTSANSAQVSVTPAPSAATIAIWDGSLSPVATALNTSTISASFTVSAGASVLVVQLFDKNGASTDFSPATLSWGSQTLTKSIGQVDGTRDFTVSSIYYLFNPTPGTHTIMATDTSVGPVTALAMQVFTLAGVDPGQGVTSYGHTDNFTHPIASDGGNPITLGAGTPASAYATFIASEGQNVPNINVVPSSGAATFATQGTLSGSSVLMGDVSGLVAGTGTIAIDHETVDGIGTVLAVSVFAPAGAVPSVTPNAPTLSVHLDATGTNLVVSALSQLDHRYYLLSTPSLTPPVVWTTNGSTGGTGGIITNVVPILPNVPDLFLQYKVQ